MKINLNKVNEYLAEFANGDAVAKLAAARNLAQFGSAEWEASPDPIEAVVTAVVAARPRHQGSSHGAFRVELVKVLGNIGARTAAVVGELRTYLVRDNEEMVRIEAARALGKIGKKAEAAGQTLAKVLADPKNGEKLRGEAARALASVGPEDPGTIAHLTTAAKDSSGHVSVCAAEALWRASGAAAGAVAALAARLADPAVRAAATQALYRIGPDAKAAVPALLAAAKDKDRLFRESVVMALTKIDPPVAARVKK